MGKGWVTGIMFDVFYMVVSLYCVIWMHKYA